LFAAIPENLNIQLVEASGRVVWKGSVNIQASTPSVFSIASNNLGPGLYYLQVMDEYGRSKTDKVVVSQ